MDKTKIEVVKLVGILSVNREKHELEYKLAKKEWRKRCTKALKRALKDIENGKPVDEYPFRELPKPRHYLADYDRVLRRLELELDHEVELTEQEFVAWVMDEWNWHGAFVGGTSLYNSR